MHNSKEFPAAVLKKKRHSLIDPAWKKYYDVFMVNYDKYRIAAGAAIVLFCLLGYVGIRDLGLTHWDDAQYVLENLFIRSLSPRYISGMFAYPILGNYAPIQQLSYAVDFQLWGFKPFGYHLTNLLLHILNSLALYFLVSKITRKYSVGWIAAALFAVHPIQVETVAWVSQRKTLLAQFFFLLSFLFYLNYSTTGKRGSFILSLLSFIVSLLSKVSTITLPILLLMYDHFYSGKRFSENVKEKAPFFLTAALFSGIAVWAQKVAYTTGMPYHGGSLVNNLMTSILALGKYVVKLLLPFNLSAYYSFAVTDWKDPAFLVSAFFLAAVLCLFWLYRAQGHTVFWAAWFFIALLPNMQIVPLDAVMADRYLYLPGIGAFVLMALAIQHIATQKRWTYPAGILITGIVLCLIVRTYSQVSLWKNEISLWSYSVRHYPSPTAYVQLGVYWGLQGDDSKSWYYCEKALALDPDDFEANRNLGLLAMQKGRYGTAERYYKKALSVRPRMDLLKLEIASMYLSAGHKNKAARLLKAIPSGSPAYRKARKILRDENL